MQIVIIDDNPYKIENIKEVLEKIYKKTDFYEFHSRSSALLFLQNSKDSIDLIILDWNFPVFDQGMPVVGMGEKLLKLMQRKGIDIDTVICSSDEVSLQDEYHNVIGQILYQPLLTSLKDQYEEILKDKKEEEVDEYFPQVIERGIVIDTPSNYSNESELFIKEYNDEKKEQKKLHKWKRKRSSDPWWKK